MRDALKRTVAAIEAVTGFLGHAALVLVPLLAVVMVIETVSRYVLDRPTMWANDLSYMINGTLMLLPAGWTLAKNAHARVETFSQRISRRASDWIHIVFYALLLPGLVAMAWVAAQRAVHAFRTNELEQMSAWAPIVWPFYTAIAVGLAGFALQCFAEIVKHSLSQVDIAVGETHV